jgi:alkylation response protein AidB-like acyl-CoA dehydrogenase
MTAIAELSLGPIAGEPGAPAEDEWVAVARDVAVQLAPDAAAREQTAEPPVAEAALFREAGLLPLIAAEEIGGLGRPYAVALTVVRQIARVDSGLARLLDYHTTRSPTVRPQTCSRPSATATSSAARSRTNRTWRAPGRRWARSL